MCTLSNFTRRLLTVHSVLWIHNAQTVTKLIHIQSRHPNSSTREHAVHACAVLHTLVLSSEDNYYTEG